MCKEMMELLDAHSKRTQDKHYILRDASDDIVLAQALVADVFGETVKWPTDVQVSEYMQKGNFDGITARYCNAEATSWQDPQGSDSKHLGGSVFCQTYKSSSNEQKLIR